MLKEYKYSKLSYVSLVLSVSIYVGFTGSDPLSSAITSMIISTSISLPYLAYWEMKLVEGK